MELYSRSFFSADFFFGEDFFLSLDSAEFFILLYLGLFDGDFEGDCLLGDFYKITLVSSFSSISSRSSSDYFAAS